MDVIWHALDEAPVFAYVLDKELRYLYLNEMALRVRYGGQTLEETIGHRASEFFPDNIDIEHVEATSQWVLDRDRPVLVYESLLGSILISSKWPLHDEFGAVYGIAVVSFDLTSTIEERVRGDYDMDLMVDMARNSSVVTQALIGMVENLRKG